MRKSPDQPPRNRPPKLSNGANLRKLAAISLFEILEHQRSAKEVLPPLLEPLKGQDRGWVQEVVFGVIRHLPVHQFWLRQLLEKPLKGNKKVLEHLIMVGFYQLAHMRVAAHAAVSETVEAANSLGGNRLTGLLNAILRNFTRHDVINSAPDSAPAQAGLPNWLYHAFAEHYPSDLTQVLNAMQQPAPLWLRINPRLMSREDFLASLSSMDIEAQAPPWLDDAVIIDKSANKSINVATLPGYAHGVFAVQDAAAQLAGHILQPRAGERGLDCCAAPGGKTAHLASIAPDLSELVAIDNVATRLDRVAENLTRLQVEATLHCADATSPDTWHDGQLFDFILCDVPCSATGVIRRNPDIRWLRKKTDIQPLVELQRLILTKMWALLAPGGRLLYSTCSILPQENTHQIANFLATQNDAVLLERPFSHLHTSPHLEDGKAEYGLQILPNTAQCDGFFYALLQKSN